MTISLTLIRAIHFSSCLILQSLFVLLLLAIIPGLNKSDDRNTVARDHYHRLLRQLAIICVLAAFVSGFLWIWFGIASMSDSGLAKSLEPGLFWFVLTQTQPGRVWLVRGGLALALAPALFFAFRKRPGELPWLPIPLCALCAMALTVSLAWLGHAGAGEGPNQNLHLASDLLHLVAAGIWPAGLAPFAIFLICFLNGRNPSMLQTACVATHRFSTLSFLTVGVLFASGIVNSYFLVGNFHMLVSTDYGLLLVFKIVLFSVAIGFGAWNLLVFKPRLAMAEESLPDEARREALKKVARNVLIELGLASLILLAVGSLGIMPPATHS